MKILITSHSSDNPPNIFYSLSERNLKILFIQNLFFEKKNIKVYHTALCEWNQNPHEAKSLKLCSGY